MRETWDKVRKAHLAGVPQVPEQAHRLFLLGIEDLPADLADECDESIECACREIRRRNQRLTAAERLALLRADQALVAACDPEDA